MSLRAARSLPSLRNALQQSLREKPVPPIPRINTRDFSSTTQSNAKAQRSPHLSSTRKVHQTAQKKSTTLLSSNTSKYGTMNLQALKMECRSKNLKVSGKKQELIQRLSNFDGAKSVAHSNVREMSTTLGTKSKGKLDSKAVDKETTKAQLKEFQKTISRKLSTKKIVDQAKAFSTTTSKEAKGDDSHIDSARFPPVRDPPLIEDQPNAPSLLSKNPTKEIDLIETKTKIAEMEGAVSVGPDNEGEVATFQNMFKDFKIDEAAGITAEEPVQDTKFEPSKDEIDSNDKFVWAGLLGGIVAWWSLKPKSDRK